ncbi:M23 family metallopeptidase [uncultured Pedobacter sp.]|uniref:M23 family metallopeptidase n=1 Tax=uncultured Pedobacter sp. TaxID=246139 RepID=UPI0025E20DA6|nr:M23 family metallopeptidase [uncultured Pedobacter sp.]
MRVPFGPTAFPNGSDFFLIYELYLTNFSASPIRLQRMEFLDGDRKSNVPLLSFDSPELKTMVKILGSDNTKDALSIEAGQSAVVYIEAKTSKKIPFPNHIIHRIITSTDSLDGAAINTHTSKLQTLHAPVSGSDWIAADGPGNSIDNHHWRGNIVLGGRAVNSRRFAIDWKKVKDSVSFSGDAANVRSYFCYGEEIFAVADGTVITATDGLPDNIPGHGKAFHPAVPLTFEKLPGNHIVIDLGDGHYAHYMHMKPGTVRVKKGDHVSKGQLLGNIGNSGDAREPHLHFEVTTSAKLLSGEGIPYVIDHYRSGSQKGLDDLHHNELPKEKEIVDFGKISEK